MESFLRQVNEAPQTSLALFGMGVKNKNKNKTW